MLFRSSWQTEIKDELPVKASPFRTKEIDNSEQYRQQIQVPALIIAVLSMLLLDEGGEISLWKRSGRGKSRDGVATAARVMSPRKRL